MGTGTQAPNETVRNTPTQTGTETPVYDCDAAYRPPEPSSDNDPPGEDNRYTYPQRPESLAEESVVLSYVEAYERAYRLNRLYSEHGTNLNHASISVDDTWTYEAPEGEAVARLKYFYGYGFNEVEADSPTIYASYYVDEAVLLRTVESGYREDESKLVPDPIEEGLPVECF